MEYNQVRRYNERAENGVKESCTYLRKQLPLINDEDRESCLRFLTHTNKHLLLCHKYYSTEYIQAVVEESNCLIYFHEKSAVDAIVSFAVVKTVRRKKGKIANILLLCAQKHSKKFGQMLANAVYTFAKHQGCRFLYTSPRTHLLRTTFLRYGYEPIFGREGIDEVLEKEISHNDIILQNHSKTRKLARTTNLGRQNVVEDMFPDSEWYDL